MLALARQIGKQTAHELVYRIAMQAHETGTDFRAALLAQSEVTAHLDATRIAELLDPTQRAGLCAEMVDAVLARISHHDDEPSPRGEKCGLGDGAR